MFASSLFRRGAFVLFLVLAACGGSKDDTTETVPPTAIARYAAAVPVAAVATLDASTSLAKNGGTLTYAWTLTGRPAGSAATIANPTAAQTTLTPDVVGPYAITLVVTEGTRSQTVAFTITASVVAPPTILSDRVEPVSGVVQLSLSSDQPSSVINWSVDGTVLATGTTATWDTSAVADGPHVVTAQIQSSSTYTVTVNRTIQVAKNPVQFTSATISEAAGRYTAVVGAQSVNGIVRVSATLDGATIGSVAAPNACTDATGAACAAGPNGYGFGGSVGSGAHVVVVTATDGIGRQLGTQLRLNVTDVP